MCWNVLVLGILVIAYVEADVRLNFTVSDYSNKNDLDIRLRKCESLFFLGDHCDPVFQFTVNVIDHGDESRMILKQEAGPFKNKKYVSHVLDVSSDQRSFPSLIEIDLDIHDSDADEDQRIARFRRQIPFTTTGQYTLHMGADVRISVMVSLECAANYYGSKCEVYCVPMSGLWTCNNVTGGRICSKPCVHGSCVLTNTSAVCVCSFGWLGDTCNRPAESRLISSIFLSEEPEPFFLNQEVKVENLTPTEKITIHPVLLYQNTTAPPTIEVLLTEATTEEYSSELPSTAYTVENNTESIIQSENQQYENDYANNGTELVAEGAVGTDKNKQSSFLITSLTVIVVIIWLMVVVAIGIILYKRHKHKRKPVYSGSLWTNTAYGSTQQFLQKPNCSGYAAVNHNYENTSKSTLSSNQSTPKIFHSASRPRSSAYSRGTLPQIPANDQDQLAAPPIITGTKIRFAATTVTSLPSNYKYSASDGLFQPRDKTSDPYEELPLDNDCYSTWEAADSVETSLPNIAKDKSELS